MAHYNPKSVELTDTQLQNLTAARLLNLYKAVRAFGNQLEAVFTDDADYAYQYPQAAAYRERIKAVLDTKSNVPKTSFRKVNQRNGHKQKMVTSRFTR